MSYDLKFIRQADKDIITLKKTDGAAYKKLIKLLEELIDHLHFGTGKPQLKKYGFADLYWRRITQKHRLIYSVSDSEITVYVISAMGHYGDK